MGVRGRGRGGACRRDRRTAVASRSAGRNGLLPLYLAIGGGAAAFYLWVFALQRTTPTRVANTMTVNLLAAGIVALFVLGEPFGLNLAIGLVAVAAGIFIASTERA